MTGYLGRCAVCFHAHDVHLHYTSEADTRCGICGPRACPSYVDPRARWPRLTREQRLTRQIALQRIADNAVALLPFVQSRRDVTPPPAIPSQRPPSEPPRRRGGPIVDPAEMRAQARRPR